MRLISKLIISINLEGDILYSQGDSCDELFFLYKGKVVLYLDISDHVNMAHLISPENAFNVNMVIYGNGTYFGDNDVLLYKNGYR